MLVRSPIKPVMYMRVHPQSRWTRNANARGGWFLSKYDFGDIFPGPASSSESDFRSLRKRAPRADIKGVFWASTMESILKSPGRRDLRTEGDKVDPQSRSSFAFGTGGEHHKDACLGTKFHDEEVDLL